MGRVKDVMGDAAAAMQAMIVLMDGMYEHE